MSENWMIFLLTIYYIFLYSKVWLQDIHSNSLNIVAYNTKQCRPRSDHFLEAVWSGSAVFAFFASTAEQTAINQNKNVRFLGLTE